MKVVYIKKNKFKKYKIKTLEGFKFKPRNKNIKSFTIIKENLIKEILTKKISKDIKKATKAIRLMLKSNVTEVSDCNIMIEELNRIASKIEKKYMKYFSEFEYFDLIKDIYYLNMEILTKKIIIEDNL